MKIRNAGGKSVSSSQQIFKWVEASYGVKMFMQGVEKQKAQFGVISQDVDARDYPGQETVTMTNVPSGKYELIVVIGSTELGQEVEQFADKNYWKPAPTVQFYLPGFEKQSAAVTCQLKLTQTCKAVPLWRVGIIDIGKDGGIRIYEGNKGWRETEPLTKMDLPRREKKFKEYTKEELKGEITPVIESLKDEDPEKQESCISECTFGEGAEPCLVKDND